MFEVPQKKSVSKSTESNNCLKIENNSKPEDIRKSAESNNVAQSASQIIEDEESVVMNVSFIFFSLNSSSRYFYKSKTFYMWNIFQLSTIDFDDGSMDVDFSFPATKSVIPQKNKTDVQTAATTTTTTCKTSVKSMKIGNAVDLTEIAPQLVKIKDEEEVFRFYYLDAYENPYKNPGTVYLFGKTYVPKHDMYCSCCVMVHFIPRRIYLLPRKYVCI